MKIIGHRGVAGLAPENTLASFTLAADRGLAMVEFDVRLSRDGVPLVFHDDTLERCTDGEGPVAATDWAEIARLDAGSWFSPIFAGERVPSLEQVLHLCLTRNLAINIEIKPDAGRELETANAALALALTLWPDSAPPPVISSFHWECVDTASRLAPRWPRALLAETLPPAWRDEVRRRGATALHLDHRHLDEGIVATILAEGIGLRAYTVNDSDRARQLASWNVEAVFSDFPHSS